MESTGVYWKPICYVLEDAFTCVLANAAQIALVPGRKTDVKDCAWIAQLLEHPRSRRLGRPGARRRKLPALRQALAGRFRPHHAFLVSQVLAHLDYLDEVIETLSTHLDEVMAPFAAEVSRLDTIPGVNKRTAEVLIAEIGVDMGVFPTAGHLASGAGLCPGNNESAGKHRSGKTRKGNRWLRGALIQAALAGGTRSTKGAFAARYRRVMRHRGHKKAVVAVAHAMAGGCVLSAGAPHHLPRAGGRLLRASPCGARPPSRRSALGASGVSRDPRTRGVSARCLQGGIF